MLTQSKKAFAFTLVVGLSGTAMAGSTFIALGDSITFGETDLSFRQPLSDYHGTGSEAAAKRWPELVRCSMDFFLSSGAAMSTKLKPIDQQVIVITGATSGIGLATAESAAEQGAKVVLAGRK